MWALDTDPAATRHVFDVLGLHRTSAGVLPLFLIYLSVLMYNYLLDPYQPGMAGLSLLESGAAAQAAGPSALGSGQSDANCNTDGVQQQQQTGSASGSTAAGAGAAAVILVAALQGWASKLWTLQRLVAHKLWYHIRCVVQAALRQGSVRGMTCRQCCASVVHQSHCAHAADQCWTCTQATYTFPLAPLT